ncbi:LysR family transcriptional regulator [Pokkaliibacter sp. CJK22405]|uniref:LysR family transcriptional regulator n=1 Tax=Pokkaliibacter sp. CJK22405 TaxID=3384615 RepID=UPI003984BB1E
MNLLIAMQSFCKVTESNNFAAAAREMNLSPAQISKQISALESHLGVRLLNRTTRKVTLTEAGQAYYQKCRPILQDINTLEASVSEFGNKAKGLIRVTAPVDFGGMYLMEPVAAFQNAYPDVSIELHLSDERLNLIERGMDVAIRIGDLKDSSLVAKRLAQSERAYLASPEYLKKHGEPKTPEDLAHHQVLHYLLTDIKFLPAGEDERLRALPTSRFSCNNGRALCEAAALGQGIISKPMFLAAPYIREKRLQPILTSIERPPLGIYALYLHRAHVPPKITRFVDFLARFFKDHTPWAL